MVERKRSGEHLDDKDAGKLPEIICHICDDRGFLSDNGIAVACECTQNAREKRLQRDVSDFPSELERATFENYQTTTTGAREARDAAYDLITGDLVGLLLEGDAGLGKSHLAAAVCRELRLHGRLARFIFVPDLLAMLRVAIHEQQSSDAIVDSYATEGFLVLDDFGRGRAQPTAFEIDVLTRIIQARYAGDVPFIITTNRTFDDVAEHFGRGIADRMWNAYQPNRYRYVQLFGRSKRTSIDYSEYS